MNHAETGLIEVEKENSPVTTPVAELVYFCKRLILDTAGFVLLVAVLPWVWVYNRISPPKTRRVMVGTHPIVSNIHYKHLLEKSLDNYAVEVFIFKDWLGEASYFDIETYDVVPRLLVGKNPYALAPYFIFIWAMRRYQGFYWHLDGAMLERTLLWQIEPFLLHLFGKKVVMQAYGSDQWSLLESSHNLNFKYGLSVFRRRYFMMDFKRIRRNYMWAKFADRLIGDFRYLPRIGSISMAHYYIELDDLPFHFNDNTDTIVIAHFANHPERKGSDAIEAICNELIAEGYPLEYRSVYGGSRQEALSILDTSHIFIEHLFNGTFGTATLEAMAKGNVVFTNLDPRLVELCLVQNYPFYGPFFRDLPIIDTNVRMLKSQIIDLIRDKQSLKNRAEASRRFIEESTQRVIKGFASQDENGLKALFERGR